MDYQTSSLGEYELIFRSLTPPVSDASIRVLVETARKFSDSYLLRLTTVGLSLQDETIRNNFAYFLSQLKLRAPLPEILEHTHDPGSLVRGNLLLAIGNIGIDFTFEERKDKRFDQIICVLVAGLEDEYLYPVSISAEYLGKLGLIAPLIEYVKKGPQEYKIDEIDSKNPFFAALLAIAESGNLEGIQVVRTLLSVPMEEYDRQFVVSAIGVAKDDASVDKIMEIHISAKYKNLKNTCIDALCILGSWNAKERLLALLGNTDDKTKVEIFLALRRRKVFDEMFVPVILSHFGSEAGGVSAAAIELAGDMRLKAAVPKLKEMEKQQRLDSFRATYALNNIVWRRRAKVFLRTKKRQIENEFRNLRRKMRA